METEDKRGFFTDSKGNPSSMRLNSHLALWVSFILAGLTIYIEYQGGIVLTTMFLVGAFAPKAVQ